MKCLLLGGGGFIGSHTVDALLGHGHDVRVFERDDCDMSNLAHVADEIEAVRGDFFNASDLQRSMQGMDVIVHLVSTTLPKSSNEDMAGDIQANVIGTLHMLDAARKAGVRKVIFASSGGTVYGVPQSLPVTEEHPTWPICSHGIGKLTVEKYLHLYHYLHGLDYCVLRIANPYGARQNPLSGQGVVAAFLRNCLRGEPVTIWGDGSAARDFFYVVDLAEAIRMAVEHATPSRVYNIGSGESHTLHEMLDVVRAVTGCVPEVRYHPARNCDVPATFLDIARVTRELAWQPRTSLDEGIART